MISRLTKRQSLIAGGVAAVVLVGGITTYALVGNGSKKAVAAPSSSATPKPTPPTSAAPKPKPKPPALNYLTGVGAPSKGPVVAVKIDDTDNGRPSVNLNEADIVYIEQAEGGLTRLVAVFGTNHPTVEPVRSTRASDPELLTQYGKITLVASGGGGLSLPTLDKSIINGVINDRGGPGFFRDGNRPAPYNLGSNLAQVAAATKTAAAKYIGFNWANAGSYPSLKTKSKSGAVANAVVGSTPVTFQWNTQLKRYVRIVNGSALRLANGNPVATPNVLIQFCKVSVDPTDVDVAGNPSQYTHSVGSGTFSLFRDGRRIDGKWSRARASLPTTYTDSAGKPLMLAPGGAYVVLSSAR
ncbi:MAG TPA: DUF3048 domain-containing protein [Jatrophihabitans sp.]|jgi:hypothetical protein